jgi:hypothetical protein
MKILITTDNPGLLNLVRQMAQAAGATVEIVTETVKQPVVKKTASKVSK